MNAKTNIKTKKDYTDLIRGSIYIAIFCLFQAVLGMYANANLCLEQYISLGILPFVLTIVSMVWAIKEEGNARLVLYVGMLLSVGQLIQSILKEGELFEPYREDYLKFMIIGIMGSLALYWLYHKFFVQMYTLKMQFAVCAVLLLCFLILRSPLGDMRNNAYLWVDIGGFSFQLTEIFKPLFVVAMAGFLCKPGKVSNVRLILAFGFTALVAGLCVVVLNEFGTGIVLAITGVVMIFLFQNTKSSGILIGVVIAGIVAVAICFGYGTHLYKTIPKEVSTQIFAEEFASTANREKLEDMLTEHISKMTTEKIAENEERMGVTYNEIGNFLLNGIRNDEIGKAFPSADKKLSDVQNQYIAYVKVLVEDEDFREKYRSTFIEKKIYTNRMLAAYEKNKAEQQDSSKQGILKKIEGIFLENYLPIARKVQDKVRGFLQPDDEGQENAYQINDGLAAMSTGGWFGNGPDVVKNSIFAYDSDMVFAMLVTELGLLMGLVVIILNMLIFQEMIFIAFDIGSYFGYAKGICIGFGFSWITQAFFLIGGNCRVFPFSGITLPMVSNGGSSLVVSICMIALVLMISVHPIGEDRNSTKWLKKNKKNDQWKKTLEKKKVPVHVVEDEEDDDVKIYTKTKGYTTEKKNTENVWKNPFEGM